MSTNEECPICFDKIEEKNNITTECGHKFHASCLMTNITRNGFGCPCCRTLMAVHDEDDNDESTISSFEEDEIYNDYSLRGLRFFTNLLENQENDVDDVEDEEMFNEAYEAETQRLMQNEVEESVPSLDFIILKLKEQGITYEQLVANSLTEFEEYEEDETINRHADNLWGKIRTIVSNYHDEETFEQGSRRTDINDID